MLIHRGWSEYIDILRDDLWEHHPEIHIVDFDFYNMETFNRCENSNDVLLAVKSWESIHPLMKIIPVNWNYGIPTRTSVLPGTLQKSKKSSGCH